MSISDDPYVTFIDPPHRKLERGPQGPRGRKLEPLYTEKLPKSPHFPSLAEAAQRRRDFWMKLVARGSIGMMVGSGAVALWLGTSPAFKAFGVIGGIGLIIFVVTCFPSLTEAAQRRRDFWMKLVARGGMVSMAGAFLGALWYGPGVIPAGAFVAGLIIFIATCFVSGNCRRP